MRYLGLSVVLYPIFAVLAPLSSTRTTILDLLTRIQGTAAHGSSRSIGYKLRLSIFPSMPLFVINPIKNSLLNAAILLPLTRSFHFCYPFCDTTVFTFWWLTGSRDRMMQGAYTKKYFNPGVSEKKSGRETKKNYLFITYFRATLISRIWNGNISRDLNFAIWWITVFQGN